MVSDSVIHSMAGAVGGMAAMTVTYPLVFLSTRAAVEIRKERKSTYQAVLDVVKSEGLGGLYSGLESSLIAITVTNGVYYYFYERSRGIILGTRAGSKALSTPESILIGLIAGSATSLISNPIWVVQTAQTVRTMSLAPSDSQPEPGSSSTPPEPRPVVKKLGFLETLLTILRKGGPAELWRGIGPALVLVINPVIQYTVFEQLKNILVKGRTAKLRAGGNKSAVAVLTDIDYFLLGALSKLFATGTTYPYIVIKSRLQAGSADAQRYKSALDGLLTVVREEGIGGLYKGIGSKLTQSVLTAAILFACQRRIYETIKKVATTVA
ncbi:mitochondrial carrier [Schizopora paradoxa]|uniref:Mitochondrial carrier n=1 Tax=Schizopora paradoxa TaxID=27342 RepID=A0A0H2RAH2_9AGAM|nr:mitochondrial carrier [Schizopora paradoxa]